MSIGDPYATLADFKTYLADPNLLSTTQYDTALMWTLNTASKKINKYCGRQFNLSDAVSARVYSPGRDPRFVEVDDFVLSDDFVLQTDPSGTGDFEITWDNELDYELLPFNGVVDGDPGWPFFEIHAVAGVWFPRVQFRRKGTVKVTALWGWPEVPDEIHQATLIMAQALYKAKEAPFGVAGFSAMGALMKVKDVPMAAGLLEDYMTTPVNGG